MAIAEIWLLLDQIWRRKKKYNNVHLGVGVTHHGNEKVEKEEEDDHDEEAPVDLAFSFKLYFLILNNFFVEIQVDLTNVLVVAVLQRVPARA